MKWEDCQWLRRYSAEDRVCCSIHRDDKWHLLACLKESCPIVMLGEKVDRHGERLSSHNDRIYRGATDVNNLRDMTIEEWNKLKEQIKQLNQRLDNQQIDMDVLRRRIANEDKDTDSD